MIRKKCDECNGKITHKKVPYELYGIKLGDFPAEVCGKCGEICFSEEVSRKMTQVAKKKGLWGLETKTTIGKVGDALDVRFSKRLVDFFNLRKGGEVLLYPEDRNKIAVEFKDLKDINR